MKRRERGLLVKLLAIILVISMCTPVGAHAAEPEAAEPRASAYLMAYTANKKIGRAHV